MLHLTNISAIEAAGHDRVNDSIKTAAQAQRLRELRQQQLLPQPKHTAPYGVLGRMRRLMRALIGGEVAPHSP